MGSADIVNAYEAGLDQLVELAREADRLADGSPAAAVLSIGMVVADPDANKTRSMLSLALLRLARLTPPPAGKPRSAPGSDRRDDDHTFHNVDMVRVERLSLDAIWVAIYALNGSRSVLQIQSQPDNPRHPRQPVQLIRREGWK
jgi:hypothetical protein